MVIAYNKERRW